MSLHPAASDARRVYYFGCWDGPGHFLFTPDGRTVRCNWQDFTTPTPWTLGEFDAPDGKEVVVPVDPEQREGVWRLSHQEKAGVVWTAYGCHDRTCDRRRGACAVFVAEGQYDEAMMRELAARFFPAVWARIQHGTPPPSKGV